jgi:hypothetical protein
MKPRRPYRTKPGKWALPVCARFGHMWVWRELLGVKQCAACHALKDLDIATAVVVP